MLVERCEGERLGEQLTVLEVKGTFNEEKLIKYLERYQEFAQAGQILSIQCQREYGNDA